MLLKYSIVMTSSDTIISKGEKWVWNSVRMVNQLVYFYQISSLSPAIQGVQIKML